MATTYKSCSCTQVLDLVAEDKQVARFKWTSKPDNFEDLPEIHDLQFYSDGDRVVVPWHDGRFGEFCILRGR